jgi:hypothetical protein
MLSNTYDYGMMPGTYNKCNDAIQRFNTFGQDEYYLTGFASPGIFGSNDVMVTKIDQFGNPVAGEEFTYGGPGYDEGRSLDQDNVGAPGPPAGLSIYGTSDMTTGQPDLYLVKAYFNGLSGCNEAFSTSIQAPFFFFNFYPEPVLGVTINPASNLMQGYSPMFDNTLCFSPTIFGGSNARVAPGEAAETPTDDATLIMPNPANAGIKDVKLQVQSTVEGPANIQIYDMQGKQYYNQQHMLNKGLNKLPIDISIVNMAPGLYTVKILGDTQNKTVILVVK